MNRERELEAMKIKPLRAGEVLNAGPNRRERRAAAAADRTAKPMTMPKSIWRIVGVIEGLDVGQPIRTCRLRIERAGRSDTVVVHTKEGQPPQRNGLLERMTRGKGEAFIWTDADARKESMGGGYTHDAMPEEWKQPAPAAPKPSLAEVARRAEDLKNSNYSMPTTRVLTAAEYREAAKGDFGGIKIVEGDR